MPLIFNKIIELLDLTIHPEVHKRGGMPLVRSRMLSFACLMISGIWAVLTVIIYYTMAEADRVLIALPLTVIPLILLLLNRWTRRANILSAIFLLLIYLLFSLGICAQGRSIFAPGLLLFPVGIMLNFLLCGRRVGLVACFFMLGMALFSLLYLRRFGALLPFDNDPEKTMRALIPAIIVSNSLSFGIVTIYFSLVHSGEKKREEQRSWVLRTARMQELLLMSRHFALQTNGPLDILGTALHNLEDPVHQGMQPGQLLPLLIPVEKSIQEMAAVARSFSLFSRRYLEEGWEQTSVNAIFQHVDMIYNVGTAMRKARLHWQRVDPDILVHTQTAKIVMLLISLLRSMGSSGGTQLQAESYMENGGLVITMRYKVPPPVSRHRPNPQQASDIIFDPELNEDLIKELSGQLGIKSTTVRTGGEQIYQLKLAA